MNKLDNINRAKTANTYKKYIEYIRFPKYKNFVEDTKIVFDFPITIFVGKNGSGKSSILKALYGCILDKNINDYWFSTKVDPIKEGQGDRNCFIYNYFMQDENPEKDYEVLIQRAPREGNPDYWETSRPIQKYNMLKNPDDPNYRKEKLINSFVYFDFHAILSAFDKYRYFLNRNRINETNNYLRSKSRYLKNVISNNVILNAGPTSIPQNKKPVKISNEELIIISNILDKVYKSAEIIEHKFFQNWGQSVIFELNHISYSEAFAGSGENAVVTLVHEINNLPNNSLVLLDEPETCLHPGAQKKIFEYLVDICLNKKMQIIISTHSREFLFELPSNAIKVFNELPNGKIEIIPECNYNTAFYYIGTDVDNKKTIIVEDRLAKEIVSAVAKKLGTDIVNQINIVFPSGGAKEILKSIANYTSINDTNKYVILDGDEKLDEDGNEIEIVNPDEIAVGNLNSNYLGNKIRNQIQISNLSFFPINSNETEEHITQIYFDYLKYIFNKVKYLPKKSPEEIIWDDDYISMLISQDTELLRIISETEEYKEKFRMLTEKLFRKDRSDSVFATQDLFITNWINKKDDSYNKIATMIFDIIR
ncbi:MAG: AAA family ATPase [Bacteroidetes bacterium]|nr:AAA family ATPase [Bacteroidota bacterium]